MLNIFSEELRNKREEVGLTIQQISSKTRIDKKFIEFIEQGNFTFLPELYVKSFLREYAEVIGLNPEETIKKYQLAKEGKLSNHSEPEIKETDEVDGRKNSPDKITLISKPFFDDNIVSQTQTPTKNKNEKLLFISASIIGLLLIFIIYFYLSSQKEIIVEETPLEEIINQDKERVEELVDNSTENPFMTSDSLSLEIFSKDTTWIYLILDNSAINEQILYPNRSTTIKSKTSFEGTIGNSGSAVLKLNNVNLNFIGRKYLPRHFRIHKQTGLEYLNSRPFLNDQNVR